MWLRRGLGDTPPAAPYQGQSFIIMTRSGGSGNVEKERSGELGNGFVKATDSMVREFGWKQEPDEEDK